MSGDNELQVQFDMVTKTLHNIGLKTRILVTKTKKMIVFFFPHQSGHKPNRRYLVLSITS